MASQGGLSIAATTTKEDTSIAGSSSEADLQRRENRWNTQAVGGSAEHRRGKVPHRVD